MEIKETIKRCVRILYISRKPTDEEFLKVARVTAMGIVVIGAIGLVISLVLSVVP